MQRIKQIFSLCLLVFLAWPVQGKQGAISLVHDGYVDSVEEEKETHIRRLSIPVKPESDPVLKINSTIFDDRLTSEFKKRYREKFGRTTAEQKVKFSSRYNFYVGNGAGFTAETNQGSFRGDEVQRNEANKQFGNYMFKRLTEHHMDSYLKSRPEIQKIHQVKEQISNVKLQISEKVRVRINYDFSGNFLRLRVTNPWVENQFLVEMDPSKLGPTNPNEVIFSMNKTFGEIALASHVRMLERSVTLIGSKRLTPSMSATLTSKVDARLNPADPESDRENMMLTGVAWSY